jgi:hypothetical protein
MVLAGLLVGGGLVDRGSPPGHGPAVTQIRPMPAAAPASALSSSWFCAGAVGRPARVADGSLIIANQTTRLLHATVTLIPSEGPVSVSTVQVGAYDRISVLETGAGQVPLVGAEVDLDGGGAAVEQQISGTQGTSTAACATTGSDHWYFADGTTQEGATLDVSLLNPYPEDAIVDLSFVTEQGVESPAGFQGIVVPARSLLGVDVGTHLRRRARVATTVAARAGRVVAWKTQLIGPQPPGAAANRVAGSPPPRLRGLSLVLGSPSPGTVWWWPDGLGADGVTERYQIYNPTSAEADVSLALTLEQGSADPLPLKIAPHDVAVVVTNNESRIPKGVAHSATLQSDNGVGVVAERTVEATAPSPQSGQLDLLGARGTSRRWLLASGEATSTQDEWVIVFNPGVLPVNVSIEALAFGSLQDVRGATAIAVPPGRRLAVRINDRNPGLNQALLVEASGGVVVERDLYPVKAPGLDAAIGVPLD